MTSNDTNTTDIIQWPIKPSPLGAAGALGLSGSAEVPDCNNCNLSRVDMVCPGYHPLMQAKRPPCKTYGSYTEFMNDPNHSNYFN